MFLIRGFKRAEVGTPGQRMWQVMSGVMSGSFTILMSTNRLILTHEYVFLSVAEVQDPVCRLGAGSCLSLEFLSVAWVPVCRLGAADTSLPHKEACPDHLREALFCACDALIRLQFTTFPKSETKEADRNLFRSRGQDL